MRIRAMWLSFSAVLAGTLTVAALRERGASSTLPVTRLTAASPAPSLKPKPQPAADTVLAIALRLRGTPYCTGGTTPGSGFDCSGFVRYVFGQAGFDVPPSSTNQAVVGQAVPRAEAQPGDIIIFTGTDASRRTPGHTGIVISQPGEPLRFVHSSSARKENGVKISQVDSTRYEERFLAVRRVLGVLTRSATAIVRPTPAPVRVRDTAASSVPAPKPVGRVQSTKARSHARVRVRHHSSRPAAHPRKRHSR